MINGKTEFVEHDNLFNAIPGFLMYMPLSVGNWSLGFFFPKSEVLKDVNTLSGNMLIIGMCGFLALTAAVILISRKITLPLQLLSAKTMEIASGNLETKLPMVRSKDEVGQLTEAFQHMQQSLIKHIDDLTQTTAQKERIESELRIAREIQMGILPKLFPPFPDRDEFDIFASIEPAREVGGDLYDFFFLDRNHFCFLIGDVSGKGVPAAFFMAVTKTLLKVVADRDRFPDKILSSVNNDLASDNDSCMFVTLFLAIMDIDTGEIDYACAGHNPPILMTENGARYLKVFNEPMAGAMEGISYSSAKVNLAPGETILLYTDGVTEAMNPSNDLFSDQQLMDLLSALYEPGEEIPDPEPMIKAVTQSLSDFVQGAEPSDDITMLAVKYKNPILKQK